MTPRLSILSLPLSFSVFILFPLSCLLFAPVATTARFAHYFPFSFILPRLLILCAAERSSCTRRQFLPFILFDARQFALRYFFSPSRCYISIGGKRVKASVVSITYYTLLQNIEHYCRSDSRRKRTVVRINRRIGVLFHLPDFNQIVLLGKSEINEFWYIYYTISRWKICGAIHL